jgi:hypothetical protein
VLDKCAPSRRASRRTEDFFALVERAVDHIKYDALDRAIATVARRE